MQLILCSCYYVVVTMQLLLCSCYYVVVNMQLLLCSCYYVVVTMQLLLFSCYYLVVTRPGRNFQHDRLRPTYRHLQTLTDIDRHLQTLTDIDRHLQTLTDRYPFFPQLAANSLDEAEEKRSTINMITNLKYGWLPQTTFLPGPLYYYTSIIYMSKYRYLFYFTRFHRYWMSGASPKSPHHETFVLRQVPRVYIYIIFSKENFCSNSKKNLNYTF